MGCEAIELPVAHATSNHDFAASAAHIVGFKHQNHLSTQPFAGAKSHDHGESQHKDGARQNALLSALI